MKEEKKCKYCKGKILPKEGQKEVSKNRRYCSQSCAVKFRYYKDHEKTKEYHNNYMINYYQNNRDKMDAQTKRYRNTEAGKNYNKKYRGRPENKERNKKWRDDNRKELSRKHREYMKEYMQRPGVKAKMKKYYKEYSKKDIVKKEKI